MGPALPVLRVGHPGAGTGREHRYLHREPAAETGRFESAGSTDRGAQLFKTYCAACHGANGRGAGPASEQFRKIPPDLTKYTVNNGGVFPSERVRRIIDGTGVAAHGDRDMPVWGDAFQGGREGLTADAAKARIDLIVRFLEAIQGRAAH